MIKTNKQTQNKQTKDVYTLYTSFKNFVINFLKSNEKREYTIKELKQIYEVETNNKVSLRSYQKYIKKLENEGLIIINRHEQNYVALRWLNYVENEQTNKIVRDKKKAKQTNVVMLRENDYVGSNKIHSAHSVRFSIKYEGKQPTKEIKDKNNNIIKPKILPFGRINKKNPNKQRSKQVVYKFEGYTLKIHTKRLQIFIHNPKGESTDEQMLNARSSALKLILEFCKKTDLSIKDKYIQKFTSHHVCEKKDINKAEKQLFDYCGKEIKKRTTSVFGDRSHPNKIEHHKEEMAKGYEWHYLELPKQFPEFTKNLETYTKQIKLHLIVEKRTNKILKEIQKQLKKLNKGN